MRIFIYRKMIIQISKLSSLEMIASFEIMGIHSHCNNNDNTILVFRSPKLPLSSKVTQNTKQAWILEEQQQQQERPCYQYNCYQFIIYLLLFFISNFRLLVHRFYHILIFFSSSVPHRYNFPSSMQENSASSSFFVSTHKQSKQ